MLLSHGVRMVLDVTIDPFVMRWGTLAITWNSVGTALALLVGTWWALRAFEQHGVAASVAARIVCWVLVGGWLGSRALDMLAHAAHYAAMPRELLAVADGNGSLAGALLGGLLALCVVARRQRQDVAVWLSAAVPAVLLGVALHALGNLLTGAGWGRPTAGTWGVIYWHPAALLPPDLISVPLHPLAAYQIVLSLGVVGGWSLVRDRSTRTALFVGGGYAAAQAALQQFAGASPALDQAVLLVLGAAGVVQAIKIRAAVPRLRKQEVRSCGAC